MKKKILWILLLIIIMMDINEVKASSIVEAYTYNHLDEASNYCITGRESTCKETRCYESREPGSCPSGTIIKYKVNDTDIVTFHVMFDEGKTMTMQSQKNTISKTAWYADGRDNSKGPLTVLSVLENATRGWTNVENQTYTMGTTVFKTNKYTGCDEYDSCTTNTYTWELRKAKARMITLQETTLLGCTDSYNSCPMWLHLHDGDYGYWTMSPYSSSSLTAWYVSYDQGSVQGDDQVWDPINHVSEHSNSTTSLNYDARAVVVVDKPDVENTDNANINSDNRTNNDNKDQVVNVADTLKSAYIGYLIGVIILILGIAVIVQTYKKQKNKI